MDAGLTHNVMIIGLLFTTLLGVIAGLILGLIIAVFGPSNGLFSDPNTQFADIVKYFVKCGAWVGFAGGFLFFLRLWVEDLGEMPWVTAAKEAKKRKAAEDAARVEQYERIINDTARLTELLHSSQKSVVSLPRILISVQSHLSQASADYAEGVINPFWEQIELAAKQLSEYHDTMLALANSARTYSRQVSTLGVSLPPFPTLKHTIPNPTLEIGQFRKLVREAQKNPHFATIYELRKTNKFLNEGFVNIGNAINGMNDAISDAIRELAASVDNSGEEILREITHQTNIYDAHASNQFDQVAKALIIEAEQLKTLLSMNHPKKS